MFLSLISNWKAPSRPSSSQEPRPFELWSDDGQCLRLTSSKSLLETHPSLFTSFGPLLSSFGNNLQKRRLVATTQSRACELRVQRREFASCKAASSRRWSASSSQSVGRFLCSTKAPSTKHQAPKKVRTLTRRRKGDPSFWPQPRARERACRDRCGTPRR